MLLASANSVVLVPIALTLVSQVSLTLWEFLAEPLTSAPLVGTEMLYFIFVYKIFIYNLYIVMVYTKSSYRISCGGLV